jgi:hypothetical protein
MQPCRRINTLWLRNHRAVSTSFAVALIAVVVVSASNLRSSLFPKRDVGPNNIIYANASAALSGDRFPRPLLTLRPTGFDPSEITQTTGAFLLAVDNKSGLERITLRVTREDGTRVTSMTSRNKLREKIDLAPGRYVITETDHENWTCRLTITP